jgi:hypothetical protein
VRSFALRGPKEASVASKDKGGSKNTKKAASKDLKQKRAEKKAKKASK